MRKITLLFVLLSFTVFSFAQNKALNIFNNSNEFNSFGMKQRQSNTQIRHPKTAFNESFEGTFPPSGWTRYMADGGAGWRVDTVGTSLNGWTGTGTITAPTGGGNRIACITYLDGGTTSNNSWLITPRLTISAGDGLAFWVSNPTSYLDSIDVLVSTTTNAYTSFTTTIIRQALTGNNAWTKITYNLTTYVGQQIYIAFREHIADNTNDGGYVCLDLVSIGALPSTDAGVLNVTAPVMACSMGSAEQVKINVKNYGTIAISNIPVHYKFNNGTTVNGTVAGPLAAGATIEYTFPTTIDASAFQTDSIIAWSSITGDGDATNDYAPTYYFANIQPGTAPYTLGFEATESLLGMLVIDANSDGTTWGLLNVDTLAHTGIYSICYIYNASNAADDWLFSKCMNLTPGTYTFSFWYRAKEVSFPEALAVKYGTAKTVAGMTNSIVTLNSITNVSYLRSTTTVNIASAGTYYFGFHAISNADMDVLMVDDISITANGNPPAAAGTISGLTSVCQGQNNVIYTVPTIANATAYNWTLPSGATGTSSTNSITVNFGTSAVSGNISVYGSNTFGSGAASQLAITVNPLPQSAGTISGNTTVCQGQNSVTYTVPAIANATSYVWTLPSGATGTSTTNSITVNYSTSAVSGSISVAGHNTCGDGTASSLAVTVNNLPASAGTISGNASVCQGQNSVIYTVPAIANATSYIWTLPAGASIVAGNNTNSVTVNYSASASSGNLVVKGNNSCGDGIASTLLITVNNLLPASAGTISGNTTVCQGQNSVIYNVPTIANAASYIWTLTAGASGTSNTNSITVNYSSSAAPGNITVYGHNACGDGAPSTLAINVNVLPAAAGTISGNATVCQGQNSVTYTVPAIANATSYAWTLPSGATGTSNTYSITVNYGMSAVSGSILVTGHNSCGDGTASSLAITVNNLPASAGTISGNASVCQGQNSVIYTVPAIANATSYIWTLPAGASIVAGNNTSSITVNYSASASSGDIVVKGNSSCGDGASSTLSITVNNSIPASAGTITGNTTVCQGQNSVIYTVPTIANAASYIWTIPTGASGTSNTNSITVNYSTSAVPGNITVYGHNSCGDGTPSTLAINVNVLPAAAGTITGNTSVCQGQNTIIYTVPFINNATSYVWSLPTGASGASTTNSIYVNFSTSASSGYITVKGINNCGDGTVSSLAVNVTPMPPTPVITLNGSILHSDISNGNQWYDQTGLVNGAISQNYTVTANGDYYVIVTLNGCSSDPSNHITVSNIGIDNISKDNIKVYPNPVTNELIIEVPGNNDQLSFDILNSMGQIVFKGALTEKTHIQTGALSQGIYLIKLNTGNTVEFKMVIKE